MIRFLIEIIVTVLFCFALYRFGSFEIVNGKTVLYGIVLFVLGYLDGRRREE